MFLSSTALVSRLADTPHVIVAEEARRAAEASWHPLLVGRNHLWCARLKIAHIKLSTRLRWDTADNDTRELYRDDQTTQLTDIHTRTLILDLYLLLIRIIMEHRLLVRLRCVCERERENIVFLGAYYIRMRWLLQRRYIYLYIILRTAAICFAHEQWTWCWCLKTRTNGRRLFVARYDSLTGRSFTYAPSLRDKF